MPVTSKARKASSAKTIAIKMPTHKPASDVEASLLRGAAEGLAFIRGDRSKVRVTTVRLTARNTPKAKSAPVLEAAALKQIRAAHGMSQPVFARVLDVSPETVKGWEQGRKSPRGPVRRLLQVIEKHPRLVAEMTKELD
jgi:putative transcriptional regulator